MPIGKYEVGDIVKMKKSHPCGSDEWKILRTGVEVYMECTGCSHRVLLARPKFEKAVKIRISSSD